MAQFSDYTSIVFISHGYGSVIVPKVLGYDKNTPEKTPPDLRQHQQTLKASTAIVINFASPILQSKAKLIINWTATLLGIPRESPLFGIEIPGYKKYQKFMLENGISLLDIWQRPLSSKKVRFEAKNQDVSKFGIFDNSTDPEFKTLCRIIYKAIGSQRILRAAGVGDGTLMNKLVSSGHSFKVKNSTGQTALHLAVQRRDSPMVNLLLTRCRHARYLLTESDANGDMPLHSALKIERDRSHEVQSIVKALLDNGASPIVKNNNNLTPMEIAKDHSDTMRRLVESPQQVKGPLVQVMTKGNPRGADGVEACNKTEVAITTIFVARDGKNDTYRTSEKSVQELIYSDRKFYDIVRDLRHSNSKVPTMCRWFHMPMNNVSLRLIHCCTGLT